MSSRTYIATFLALCAAALIPLASLNILVDPTAVFGSSVFPPLVWTARQTKLKLFQELPGSPHTLVLGSSRAMKLPTDAVAQHFGGPVFNFAVASARAEDYHGIYDYVRRQGGAPEVVLIGVDVEAFHDAIPPDDRLVAVPEFRMTLPFRYRVVSRLKSLARTTSISTLWLSFKAVFGDRTEPTSEFDSDGFLTYLKWEREIAEGTHDLDREIEGSIGEYLGRYSGFTGLSEWRVRELRETVRKATEDGASVVLYITPLHPDVLSVLNEKRDYSRLRTDVEAILEQLAEQESVCAFDAGDISTFDGNPGLFYDGAHPREENNRLLLKALTREGNCALQ